MTRHPDGSCTVERIKGIRLDSGFAELCIVDADGQRIRCLNTTVKTPERFENIIIAIAVDGTPAVSFSVRTPLGS